MFIINCLNEAPNPPPRQSIFKSSPQQNSERVKTANKIMKALMIFFYNRAPAIQLYFSKNIAHFDDCQNLHNLLYMN